MREPLREPLRLEARRVARREDLRAIFLLGLLFFIEGGGDRDFLLREPPKYDKVGIALDGVILAVLAAGDGHTTLPVAESSTVHNPSCVGLNPNAVNAADALSISGITVAGNPNLFIICCPTHFLNLEDGETADVFLTC